jgi:hypothetical protein
LADSTVPLTGDWDANLKAFEGHFGDGVDVVLDYLLGPSARHPLIAAAKAGQDRAPMRFVPHRRDERGILYRERR